MAYRYRVRSCVFSSKVIFADRCSMPPAAPTSNLATSQEQQPMGVGVFAAGQFSPVLGAELS